MSLILEALKKSEANRRLGEAPDLATPFATRPPRRGPLPVLIVLIVLASAGGWWLLRAPPAQDQGAGSALVDGTAKPAAGVRATTPGTPPAAPTGQVRAVQTPVVGATAPAPDQPVGGGFVALPKPWAPGKPGAAKPAAPSNAANMNAAPAAARRPDPAAVNPTVAAPAQPAQTPAQAANAARTAAMPSVVATGAGQPAPLATATSAAPAAGTVVASGSGQQKAEPQPASASPAQPAANSVIASGAGQKKAEPAVASANAAPPPAMVASGAGQKKPEPAPATAPAPAGAAVASGQGLQKSDRPADAKTAPAAAVMPPLSAPPYNELPFATRKDLPPLKLSMHVYAVEPLQRFVILNNSRLGEGDKQEDLSVREIRPDGIVLEFRGQRFFYPRDGF